MISQDVERRFRESTSWASGPIQWSVRFFLAPGPFKRLRKLPLKLVSGVMQAQLLTLIAIEKIAR